MNEYLVKVERDSVCMGDDYDAPHSYSFNVSINSTLSDVFKHLKREKYLASVGGQNHSWEAIIENTSVAFFKGNNKYPEPTAALSKHVSSYAINSMLNIWFKYSSAPS